MTIEFDNTQAGNEGWGIFDSTGSIDGEWQFQKDDEAEKFAGDDDVWRHVWDEAHGGSAYHQSALMFMFENNRPEYDRVAFFCTTGENIPRDEQGKSLTPEQDPPAFGGATAAI